MANGKYAHCVYEGLKPIGESLGIDVAQHKGKLFTSTIWDTFSNNCPHSKVRVGVDLHSKPGHYHGGGGEFIATRKGQTLFGCAGKSGQVLGAEGVHKHTVDEAFFLFGSNPEDITSLGGGYEFYLGAGEDAEKYTLTKNTCVYVPAGVYHGPQRATSLDDPCYPIIEVVIMLCASSPRDSSHRYFNPLTYCNASLGKDENGPPRCCLLKKVRGLLNAI
jgi:hypothetical protein